MGATGRPGRRGGFTLLELMVVIGTLGVLFGLGIGMISRLNPGERSLLGQVRSSLDAARSTARSLGVPCWVRIDPDPDPALDRLIVRRATLSPLLFLGFEDGTRGAYGLSGTLLGGEIKPDGRFGQGLAHADGGAHGVEVETRNRDYFRLDRGFLVRFDLRADDRGAMDLFRWGAAVSLGLDAEGVPVGELTLQGNKDLPGKRFEIAGPTPLPLDTWVSLELFYDGEALSLGVGGREVAWLPAPGTVFYKRDEPVVLSGGRAPLRGRLDQVKLFALDYAEPGSLPPGIELRGGSTRIRFAPGGGLDPRFHPGEVQLFFDLPQGREKRVTVTRLGVVQ